jgi:hypothetical protein
MCSNRDDDESVGRTLINNEEASGGVPVGADIGIGEVWGVGHDMRRERRDRALLFVHGHDVSVDSM